MRATPMLRLLQRNTRQRRAENQIAPILVSILNNSGAGGEFHDTSGFHERDTEPRTTIGFTYDPWLDRRQ